MALLSLIFGEKIKARVGLVELDASLSESHSMNATVTEYPVEEGADIADHIRRQPDTITISGIVSDTPLVYLASLQAPSPIVDDLTRADAGVDGPSAVVFRVSRPESSPVVVRVGPELDGRHILVRDGRAQLYAIRPHMFRSLIQGFGIVP